MVFHPRRGIAPIAKGNPKPKDNRKDKRGGARPGGGRRQGTLSKRMVAIRDMTMKAMKETKRVPLETMLKNMVRFDDEAEAMDEELLNLLSSAAPGARATEKQKAEFIDKVSKLMIARRECRLDAQRCAVDAAPFMHQRLASVEMKIESNVVTRTADELHMTPEQLTEYFAKLRDRPLSAEPLKITTIDNETGEPVGEDAE